MFFSILLVEGDNPHAQGLADFLHQALPTAQIHHAGSVREVQAQCALQRFDAVLSAWELPDGGALEVLAGVKATPALVMVASGQEAQAADAMRQGFSDFVVRDARQNFWLTLPTQIVTMCERAAVMQARVQAEQAVQRLAYTDEVTQLPNRRALLQRLESMPQQAHQCGAVLLLGLDGFKDINDDMGQAWGDRVLQHVALVLGRSLRAEDVLGRWGSDEFMLIAARLATDASLARVRAAALARSLQQQLGQSAVLQGRSLRLSACVGITVLGEGAVSGEELVQRVSLALHHAKSQGKGSWRLYVPQLKDAVRQRAAMEAEIHRALECDEFVLHFQPVVQACGTVAGVEALVRWQHPVKGLLPPGIFVPVAEQSGLIAALDRVVLRKACEQLRAWREHPLCAPWTISVNISAHAFLHVDFVSRVRAILEQTQAPVQQLKMELTETLMLRDVEQTVEKMETMASWGMRFSLDDFGVGYSALAYLKQLPLSQLKLDRSFVQGAVQDGCDAAIVSTVIELGQRLGLEVVAEGVETQAQRDFLVDAGCTRFQGYFFGRPAPVHVLEAIPDRL